MKKVIIGNSSGFWGDDPRALLRQAKGGPIDYIVSDYLAEVSMSILQKQQARDPQKGYVEDFIQHFLAAASIIHKKKIRIITNAGGNNPFQCGIKIQAALKSIGLNMNIAVIEGDNILPHIRSLKNQGVSFQNIETGESHDIIADKTVSANAYVGVPPILEALKTNAQLIIAGRVTDSALAMAPMIHELGWELNDWNRMGAGMIAAHIIECGAQATGGNFTDWQEVRNWDNMGFPIVEMFQDGNFNVFKHPNTGGIVTEHTIKEQLVYEIADPANYYGPDVIADLTTLNVVQAGPDKVNVSNAKGKAPTKYIKLSMAYQMGFRAKGNIIISAPDALEKARVLEKQFWNKFSFNFDKNNTEFIGQNACHLDLAPKIEANEILLQLQAADHNKERIDEFSRQIAALILSGPPGVAVTGGRPKAQQQMAYWPALIHKKFISAQVSTLDEHGKKNKVNTIHFLTGFESVYPKASEHVKTSTPQSYLPEEGWVSCKLNKLVLARSGDKGNTTNIGLIARSNDIYHFMEQRLTPGVIKEWFSSLCKGAVTRYNIPSLMAFNFILEQSLDGGGTQSMRIDAQGKTMASALLNIEVSVPAELLNQGMNDDQ